MKKGISFKRVSVFLFAVVLTVAFMPVFGTGQADAASQKGKLIKTATESIYNQETGKYEKYRVGKYTYNKKKDPTVVNIIYYNEGSTTKHKVVNSFKYKKGIRNTRTAKSSSDGGIVTRKWEYNKKGLPVDYLMEEKPLDVTSSAHAKYTYTRSGFLKTSKSKFFDGDETTITEMKFKTVTSKGLPKKITEYEKVGGKWKRNWTYSFNKKGLLKKDIAEGNNFYTTYSYKTKKGLVTQCIAKDYFYGEKASQTKYTFTYTKKTAKKKRYSMMMNSFMNSFTDEASPFFWY